MHVSQHYPTLLHSPLPGRMCMRSIFPNRPNKGLLPTSDYLFDDPDEVKPANEHRKKCIGRQLCAGISPRFTQPRGATGRVSTLHRRLSTIGTGLCPVHASIRRGWGGIDNQKATISPTGRLISLARMPVILLRAGLASMRNARGK